MTASRTIPVIGMLLSALLAFGQPPGASSFLDVLTRTYHVEIAVAPELIPTLDSLRSSGASFSSVDAFLAALLHDRSISYQIVDGDKIMLRRERTATPVNAAYILRGVVRGGDDGSPLAFATVACLPDGPAVNATADGAFTLAVADVSGMVQVQYLGYQTMTLSARELLGDGREIRMSVSPVPLRQVTIVVPYRDVHQSYDQQSVDLNGYAFLSARELLSWNADRLLLGMTTYTPFSGEQGIRIRGSDPGNSLFLFDGVPAYDPSHFYNIFSPYNPVYFSNIEIYKNNFPIQYGGRIDGLVKADREPRPDKTSLIIDTDLLQSGLTGEVALSPTLRLSAGARFSHTGILNDALGDSSVTNFTRPGGFRDENEWSTTQRPVFDFYDINARLHGSLANGGTFTAGFFDSRDKLNNSTSSSIDVTVQQFEILQVTQHYAGQDEWENTGVSFGLSLPLSIGTTWTTEAYYAAFAKDVQFTTELTEKRPQEMRTIEGAGYQQSQLDGIGFRSYVGRTLREKDKLTFGLDLAGYDVEFEGQENAVRYIAQTQQELESTVFGQYGLVLGHAWHVDAGARLTWLLNAEEVELLPSLGLRYAPDDNFSLRASWSRNLQPLRALTTEDRFGRETDYLVLGAPDKGYPALRSDKFMAGVGYGETHWGVDVEAYYKRSDGFIRLRPTQPDPSYGDPTSPEDYYRLFDGKGWTAGVDVTLLYKHKNIDLSLLYTLSRLWEQYDELFRGEAFSPQEDRRHQLKLQGQYRFGRFIASGLISYKSRAPYFSYVALDGSGGGGIGQARGDDVFRYLPPFFSLDLGLDYTFDVGRIPVLVGASVINLTDHANIDDILHLGRVPGAMGRSVYLTQQTELLGRTGNLRLRLIF
jgi:hypothetical protein